MPQQVWVHHPDAGGVKIPPAVRQRTLCYAEKHFAGKYTRLEVRFRGQFCYVDAYTEPSVPKDWPPKDWQETQEQYVKRLRNTPTHLYRLRYFGTSVLRYFGTSVTRSDGPFPSSPTATRNMS